MARGKKPKSVSVSGKTYYSFKHGGKASYHTVPNKAYKSMYDGATKVPGSYVKKGRKKG